MCAAQVNFMRKFGYLGGNASTTSSSVASFVNAQDVESAIVKVQRFAGLPLTGTLDEQTLQVGNIVSLK